MSMQPSSSAASTSRVARAAALLVALAAPAASALLLPDAAHATSVAELSVEQMTDASTYIARGTVTEVWTEMDARGIVWTRARLAVSEVRKGPDAPAELILDTMGGTYMGATTAVHGAARFSVGEEALVYLDRLASGRLTPVAMSKGKFTLRREPHTDRTLAIAFEASPSMTFDARFIPAPPPGQRVYLDELMEKTAARLAVGWDGQPIPGISPEELAEVNRPEYRSR